MRTKLTVSRPRPSFTERAPIRPGAPRRPRPEAPASTSPARERSGDDARKPHTGKTGERPAFAPRRADGERKPYGGPSSERGERRPYGGPSVERGERKPYGGPSVERGERKPYAGKPAERGDRKPYVGPTVERGERRPYAGPSAERGERKPYTGKPVERSDRGDRPAFAAKRPDGERRSFAGKPGDRGDRGDRGRPVAVNGLEPRAPYTPRNTPKPDPDNRGRSSYRDDRDARGERGGERSARQASDKPRVDRPRVPGARDDSRTHRAERPAFNRDRPSGERVPYAGNKPARTGETRVTDRPSTPRASAQPQRTPTEQTTPTPVREDDGTMRLSKRMSELGLCSRREADEWIEKGWVRVDGERIDTLGTRVRPEQKVEVIRQAREQQNRLVTILLHKPVGHVSGQPEDGHPPAAALIVPDNRWIHDASRHRFEHVHLRALAPAGRLDIDSTGLLVFTQDGRVAKQLIGESSEVEKEYLVRVSYGTLTEDVQSHFPEQKLALLRHGLSLDGAELRPAQVDWQNGEQLRFVLHEGKKRQIRRMCELVGLEVVGLKRVRIGQVMLSTLPVGEWRYLGDNEIF